MERIGAIIRNFIDDFRDPTVGGNAIASLPEYFRVRGWHTWGSGKVFHPGRPKNNDQARSWTDQYMVAGLGSCHTFSGGHPSNYACDPSTSIDDDVAAVTIDKLASLVSSNTTAGHGKPFFVAAVRLRCVFAPMLAELPDDHRTVRVGVVGLRVRRRQFGRNCFPS